MDADRAVAVVEVVDVDPVGRGGELGGAAAEELAQDGGFADAVRAGGVEVVAAVCHAEREFDGADGALLAVDGFDRWEVVGGLEGQVVGVAAPDEVADGDAEPLTGVAGWGHGLALAVAWRVYRCAA